MTPLATPALPLSLTGATGIPTPLATPATSPPSELPAELLTLDEDESLEALGPPRPSSVPPPVTAGGSSKAGSALAALDATEDRALAREVDARFLALLRDPALPPAPDAPFLLASEADEVRALFEELAVLHVRPLRDWMVDLEAGLSTHRGWVGLALGIARPLVRSAATLDLTELSAPLGAFVTTLEEIDRELEASRGRTVDAPRAGRLVAAYASLIRVAPGPFAVEAERAEREAAVVPALLMQVPGLSKVALQRLDAAGLLEARALFRASAELVVATGALSFELAAAVVSRVQGYLHDVETLVPDAARTLERGRLEHLVDRLGSQDEALQRASRSWGEGATEMRRAARQARETTLHQVVVALVRLGEVEEARAILNAPFAHTMDRLRTRVRALNERYAASGALAQ